MVAPAPSFRRGARPWQVALLVTGLALAWQTLVVYGYFHGHWSALFLASDRFVQTQPVRAESTYVLRESGGYDGQFYHAIAHDPLDLHGTDRVLDFPPTRYTRILVPALSYLVGGGRLFWVDRAYRAIELAFLFLGVLCACIWAESRRRSAWLGVLFMFIPGVFISLERQLVDLPLCAFVAAAIVTHDRRRNTLCWASLACAGLVREMGFIAIAGFVWSEAKERRYKEAGQWALAAVPGAVWNAYMLLSLPKTPDMQPLVPVIAIFSAAGRLQKYPFGANLSFILHGLDALAIAGGLLTLILGVLGGFRKKAALASVGLAMACFGIAVSGYADYTEVYSFGRADSPLLMVQLFQAMESGSTILLWPLALMLPRSILINASMTIRSVLHFLIR